MSWVAQVKDPFDGEWFEREFNKEKEANEFARMFDLSEVYHS